MATLQDARRYLAFGFSVIPIPAPTPTDLFDGKTPAIRWTTYQRRLPTDEELVCWFPADQDSNLAIITGTVSNLVVLDADDDLAVQILTCRCPETPWQVQTGGGGYHAYYRHPGGGDIPNRVGHTLADGHHTCKLDLRGNGGFVIAPPSRHRSGEYYEAIGDWSCLDVPIFDPDWLATTPPQRPPRIHPSTTHGQTSAVDRARRYLAAIPPPIIGQGSDARTLYAAARLVRGFELLDDDALELLWAWCGERPGWTVDWVAKKITNARRYGSEVVGGLR